MYRFLLFCVFLNGCANLVPTPAEVSGSISCERALTCSPTAETRVQKAYSDQRGIVADLHVKCVNNAYSTARKAINNVPSTNQQLSSAISGSAVTRECDEKLSLALAEIETEYKKALASAKQSDAKYQKSLGDLQRVNQETPEEPWSAWIKRQATRFGHL